MGNEKIRVIQMIHIALGLSVLAFLMITLFLAFNENENIGTEISEGNQATRTPTLASHPDENGTSLPLLLGMLSTGMIIGSAFIVFKFIPVWMKAKAKQATNLESEKYAIFTTAHVVRIALLDGPALLALVGLFLYISADGLISDFNVTQWFFSTLLVFFSLWLYFFPSKNKIDIAFETFAQ